MSITGTEVLFVTPTRSDGTPGPVLQQTTTGAIAALAQSGGAGETINTAITTVGAGVLTGAAITGGVITRTGPVAAFNDTTDTAVAIVAAIGAPFVGQSFFVNIKNGTNFAQTLLAGSGVTLSGVSIVIPPSSVGQYLVTLTSLTAVTLLHIQTTLLTNNSPEVITVLNTVGAGVITGAGIAGGITTRGGAQSGSAFSDTSDTATAIIAAQNNAHVGVAWEYTYVNNTDAKATILGGTGVTPSGITVVPANGWVKYLVTYTATTTITMASIANGSFSADATDATKQVAFKASGATTGKTLTIASVVTADRTLTAPDATGTIALASPAPVAVGSSLAITAAMSGAPILLDTAGGSTATLPAATGSGNKYAFYVKTTATSNAHKILAASGSDFINGIVTGENANTAKCFASAAATNHSIQMPFAGTQPSGGFIGDWFEFTDIAANLWTVRGMYQAGTTPTTPFSAATS